MHFTHIACAVLLAAIWGFNFVAIAIGLEGMPPLLLCCTRFFLASIPIVFFLPRPPLLKWVFLYGLVLFALQFTLMFASMKIGLSAGLASLLIQLQSFFTILFAALLFKEWPNRWQIFGGLVALAGMAVVGFNLGGDVPLLGFILIISAAVSWAIANLLAKKLKHVNTFALVAWGSLAAWPPLLLLSLWVDGPSIVFYSLQTIAWPTLLALCYIVYPTTLLGFFIWNWLLKTYPVATIAPFTLLIPIFGVLGSAVMLNEQIQPWKLLAAMLVIAGLCINLFAPKLLLRKR